MEKVNLFFLIFLLTKLGLCSAFSDRIIFPDEIEYDPDLKISEVELEQCDFKISLEEIVGGETTPEGIVTTVQAANCDVSAEPEVRRGGEPFRGFKPYDTGLNTIQKNLDIHSGVGPDGTIAAADSKNLDILTGVNGILKARCSNCTNFKCRIIVRRNGKRVLRCRY